MKTTEGYLAAAVALFLLLSLFFPGLARAADPSPDQGLENCPTLAQLGFEEKEIWDDSGKRLGKGEADDVLARTPDPLEGWNRFWFQFNDKLYFYLFKPVAKGYSYVLPEKPRTWVQNFFHNLLFPVRLVNCILQGKLRSAGAETSKFIANTTFGACGLSDFANHLEPTAPTPTGEEDLGQTLGVWGFGNGVYLVWPIIGPSSIRDSVGFVGDRFLDPVTYVTPWYNSVAITAYSKINKLSLELGQYEDLKEGAIDPYAAFRDAYLRNREKKIRE
ncbi:MAG: VacJ family lipoprotein [Desulfovibrionaceae bacterium]|nr:VacJ family lipoprotein [Desulfovibrionaceae bacterium]MDD4951529.1 VacJ family lipoprotein [Desulfovibrionaceae bacterium]